MSIADKDIVDRLVPFLELPNPVVVCLDFDELLVRGHMTRAISRTLGKTADLEHLKSIGGNTAQGILYLNSLLYGTSTLTFEAQCQAQARQMDWRDGFDAVLKTLSTQYSLVIISSGFRTAARQKIKVLGIPSCNVIGTELAVEKDIIVGSSMIISQQTKADIVRELRKNHIVVAVGHGEGDRLMIQAAHIGIAIQPCPPGLSRIMVQHPDELIDILPRLLHDVRV